ncbi:aldo/keto reductase [Clostridium felsineum]|uniref:aldo/keto reductase n=1 Tax=Clostridium felsineum TaxID=36839 RepID=UPI00214D8CDD|nr:aldo/keto reductase [Clostridium felsineum]MCR3761512.1 aldo/keto reductase [Clostridium felsineum]
MNIIMKEMPLEKRKITSSRLILGCSGFTNHFNKNAYTKEELLKAEKAVDAALATGITMFDCSDSYCMGKAEMMFGEILSSNSNLRENIIIQSKCGSYYTAEKNIKYYDLSKKYILNSVDEILKRLNTEYLDILIIPGADPLMEVEEISETFDKLIDLGKVKHFGVSNMNTEQIKYLNSYCKESIIVNQNTGMNINFSDGIIEYCNLKDIQIQAYLSLENGIYDGNIVENISEVDFQAKRLLEKVAKEKETTLEAIVLGWLMKHPAMIQPVLRTINTDVIQNCRAAIKQAKEMNKEEWYELYNVFIAKRNF